MEWIVGILVAAFLIRLAIFLPQERRAGKRLKQVRHEREIIEALEPYMVSPEGRNPLNAAHDLPQTVAARAALLEIEAKAKSWDAPPEFQKSNTALLNVISRTRAEWDAVLHGTHQERQELDFRSRKAAEYYIRTHGVDPDNPDDTPVKQQSILHAFLFGYSHK